MAGAADRHRIHRPAMAAVLLSAAAAAGLVAVAAAATGTSRHQAQLDSTVRFLQEDQNEDGGFGGEKGAASDPDFTSWVALALAAADVNPHSQARPGETDAYTYLERHASELTLTTDFERALLVVDASESPPQPLGGVNLVEKILQRRLPTGAFTHEEGSESPGMNDTIFAILALSPIEEPAIEAVVREAAEWVIAEQDSDHSWPSYCPKSVCGLEGRDPEDSTDMTGAAIEALNAAGMHDTEAQRTALDYLRETQLPEGGWPQSRREGEGRCEANVGSTAWVVQGIWAAGGNPEDWRTGSHDATEEPLDYLTSMQQADGHVRYMQREELNGVWMTSYVAPALAGRPLPIVPPPARTEPPPPTAEDGAGAIAGGGGQGAPLFSRPKNKSKGKTPGGARNVRRPKGPARDHSHNRRGANHHQADGTEVAEPMSRAEADQEVAAVSPAASPGDGGGQAGDGNEGKGNGARGAPLPTPGSPALGASARGEEISGVVIGSSDGSDGKLAFGAPGLKSARIDSDHQAWPAIAIGVAALLAALLGVGWERRRGALA